MMAENKQTRCGFAAVIGAPNAGKSTLINALVGEKVAIVTHKVQTTRARMRAIVMEGDSQIIVVDTPGIFRPKRKLERAMVTSAWQGVSDADILGILGKMVKQRQDSVRAYEEGGRLELAERERAEIEVIEEFLPKQLDDDEIAAAIDKAVKSTGAESIRDMGKVMGALKSKYTGQMDFGQVGPMVKDRLAS